MLIAQFVSTLKTAVEHQSAVPSSIKKKTSSKKGGAAVLLEASKPQHRMRQVDVFVNNAEVSEKVRNRSQVFALKVKINMFVSGPVRLPVADQW
jgi:hypothetical protein